MTSETTPTAPSRRRVRWQAAVGIAAALSLVAACGSSKKESSDTSGAAATTAAGAATTASGGAATTASGGAATTASGGSAAGGTGVEAAKAATEKNKQEPTTIGVTEPLKEKPPTGKLFVWMQCDVNQCKDEGDGLKAATEAIGWDYKSYNYQSADPASLVSAMKQALQDKPAAVGLSGLPPAVWQNVIPDYKAAGVPIVTGYIGTIPYDDTIIGQVGSSPDVEKNGQMIGNWVVADSDGKANVLLQSVNDFPILKVFSDSFKKTVADNCPDCKVTEVNNTIAQLGTAVVPSIVAAIQKDPSIKYVATVNGPFVTGLRSALDAAGLNDVQIAGESGDVANLTNVKAGKESAFTALALHYGSYSMLDMVLRHLQGLKFEPDGNGGLPSQLLTKDVDFEISNSYDKPSDFADQFKKLWLVG
jgi:ribose transport system substrate-binding protein